MQRLKLEGMRFGLLVVLRRIGSNKSGESRFLAQCDCGGLKEVQGQELRHGRTKSCGCLQVKHKMAGTPEYRAWGHALAADEQHETVAEGRAVSLIQARYGADVAEWLPGNALSFDTETTGVDPTAARVVSAHVLEVGPDGAVERGSWLVNPGVEIPARVTAIHGITNEKVRAEGLSPRAAVPGIAAALADGWARGLPLIVMNAGYDLTLLAHELARLGLPELALGPVLDPLCIDRLCRPQLFGGRKLADLAVHYGVKQTAAHSSRDDALVAARVVWKQARLYRETFSWSLAEMQKKQADAHRLWAEDLERYFRRKGRNDVVEREWPQRPLKGAA